MSTDVAESVRCPFLVVAGEEDDLGPIDHTWSLLQRFRGPRELVLYQGERHGIAGGAASSLGPHRDELVAEWFVDRLGGSTDGRPPPPCDDDGHGLRRGD